MNDNPPTLNGHMPDEENMLPAGDTTLTNLNATQSLSPKQALELLVQDPVGFIQSLIENAAKTHLANLKDEAELKGALNVFRKTHPEFTQFEPFIMQETAALIQNDPDGAIDPWPQLLEKAMNNFKQRFADTIKATQMAEKNEAQQPPYIETATNRALPEQPQSFTREQIAKMSLQEFLKNEVAINKALKENRIR